MGRIFGDSTSSSAGNTGRNSGFERQPALGFLNFAIEVQGPNGEPQVLRAPSLVFKQGDAAHEKFAEWFNANPEKAVAWFLANAKVEYRPNTREQKLAVALPSFD